MKYLIIHVTEMKPYLLLIISLYDIIAMQKILENVMIYHSL